MVQNDWTIIVQVLCLGGGTLLQGSVGLANFLNQQINTRFLLNETYSLYEQYEAISSDFRVYLNKGIRLLSYLMKVCAFINAMLVVGMASFTFLYNYIYGTNHLIVQGIGPGIDPNTTFGYYFTSLVQFIFIGVGGFGLYAVDMGFLTPISQIVTFKGIMRCKFHNLNEILDEEDDDNGRHKTSLDVLKDIIKFHQKYLIFLQTSQFTFYWVILVKISTYALGIVCTMFCIMVGAWPSGYVYLLYCFVMMYVYCGMGTMVEIANDEFIEACYNDVNWYKMSISEKKMLLIMMIMTQNTGGLTIGSVMPLSMNTGLQVTKTVYSIAMMLLNFTE
ncbi:odorant receptor 67d-like isoform X1 [Haematobia irritans]|uniref:odorant receptor 67d-like isoform X1 n=1 Tax=Haematobia irritans TaxID=7368 RepID=UPI003F4FD4FD